MLYIIVALVQECLILRMALPSSNEFRPLTHLYHTYTCTDILIETQLCARINTCNVILKLPSANSMRVRPLDLSTRNTASSVMMRSTTLVPVSGRLHCGRILCAPVFAVCSMVTTTYPSPRRQLDHFVTITRVDCRITLLPLLTRSIAPPIPFTILPGCQSKKYRIIISYGTIN